MIYCPKCGKMLDETKVIFCSSCGFRVSETQTTNNQNTYATQSNYNTQANATYQQSTYPQNTGADYNVSQSSYGNENYSTAYNSVPELPMKWYKFLIYFSLYAGGVINILNGILTALGQNYEMSGISADLVYRFYGEGLRTTDIVFGIACVFLGIYAFVVRKKLAEFRSDGIKAYFSYLTIAVSICVIYKVVFTYIIEEAIGTSVYASDGYPLGAVICTSIELLCSRIYFNKRAHLFNN